MHHATGQDREIDWVNTIFIASAHLAALCGLIYSLWVGVRWESVVLAIVWFLCAGLSITGGYHRLFSHKTYRAAWPLRLFYLLFGAAGVQNSVINWSSDHRRHHAVTDEDEDPYNSRKGFWWSHVGWVLFKDPIRDVSNVADLFKDPLVEFQHNYYIPLVGLMVGVVPAVIGMAWGDPLGAFIWAGMIRLVFQYHSTFSINSLAHMFGRRPYNADISARDNGIVALITLGEGYHNFHHQFPGDYRNGVRAWHFDPTKWIVKTLSWVRITRDLRKVSQQTIDRAKLQAATAMDKATAAMDAANAAVAQGKDAIAQATEAVKTPPQKPSNVQS
jgi:stearoyl-CoA desaturase (delta-9 desaturase)